MKILDCRPIKAKIIDECKAMRSRLEHPPTLAIIEVKENIENKAYKNQIIKCCNEIGIRCEIWDSYNRLTNYNGVDGIIPLNPFDKEFVSDNINPNIDIDGISYRSLGMCITGKPTKRPNIEGYFPCTAEAVMEVIHYYNIPLEYKNVLIIGRSTTIGKPLSMLMLNENATVTICHSHTKPEAIYEFMRKADITVLATNQIGYYGSYKSSYVMPLNPDNIIIDCGFGLNEKNKISGCFNTNDIPWIKGYTPTPGGIGSITPALICKHVIQASNY